jgi:hypothetical protein
MMKRSRVALTGLVLALTFAGRLLSTTDEGRVANTTAPLPGLVQEGA